MDLETYASMLKVDKHRLDSELEIQSDVMFRICEKIAALGKEHTALLDKVKHAEFEAFKQAKQDGSSDKHAELQAKSNPARSAAFDLASDAKMDLEEWQGLYEAWKARGYSLNNLVELYKAQYFTTGPMHSSDRSERPPRRDYVAESHARREGSTPRRRVT